MLTDFYEMTMANGYLEAGMGDEIAYFDMFFRRIPDNGGFVLLAGLEQVWADAPAALLIARIGNLSLLILVFELPNAADTPDCAMMVISRWHN